MSNSNALWPRLSRQLLEDSLSGGRRSGAFVHGLVRIEPVIGFQLAQGVIADGTPDPEVLRIAARVNRVLVSRDVSTMVEYFAAFISHSNSPGINVVPSTVTIGEAIRRLHAVWILWTEESIRNQLRWLVRLS